MFIQARQSSVEMTRGISLCRTTNH